MIEGGSSRNFEKTKTFMYTEEPAWHDLMARLAGISTVLVPAAPGVLSAMGFLLADVRQVFSKTMVGVIGGLDLERYNDEIAGLMRTFLGRVVK